MEPPAVDKLRKRGHTQYLVRFFLNMDNVLPELLFIVYGGEELEKGSLIG